MKKNTKALIIAAVCLMLSACGTKYEIIYPESSTTASAAAISDSISEYGNIILENNKISVCTGAETDNKTITITEKGTYRISGTLSDGKLIIDCESSEVHLILDNAEITSSEAAAIYVKKADRVFIETAQNSVNKIISSGSSESEDKIDGAVFSKSDISFSGSGKLIINSSAHAVVGKKNIDITGGNYEITSEKKGISGKKTVTLEGGSINISSKGHGVCSDDSDSENGRIVINDNCELAIATEADGLHASGIIDIQKGKITLNAGDDGVHSDTETNISGGNITVVKSKEGIEGQTVNISGGTIDITSEDDGINAAGGKDGSASENGWGGRGFDIDENALINISGGIIAVNADGDGIDSNGKITVSGGTVYVNGPEISGNGALDYGTEAVITGGTVIAAGSSGMAVNFGENSSQCSILCDFGSTISAGTKIVLKSADNDSVIAEFTPSKKYQCVVISSPDIKIGSTYIAEAGNVSKTIVMNSLIYGESFGFNGHGKNDMFGNRRENNRPFDDNGQNNGFKPNESERPPMMI